jgi:hypothetical protein
MIWPRLLRVPLVRQVPLPSIGRLTRFKATKKRAPITIFQARAGGQDAGRRRHSCRCSRDRAWLPLPRVFGLKGHSLIYDTGEAVAAQALFLEHGDTGGASAPAPPTARPISAASRAIARCPAAPRRSPPIRAPSTSCRRSRRMSRRSLSEAGSRAAGPLPAGAPRRPAADRRLTGRRGRFRRNRAQRLGILNAPATGEALAELILGGRTTEVDLSPFRQDWLPVEAPASLGL